MDFGSTKAIGIIVSKVIFSTWQGEFIDNRGKEEADFVASAFKLPFQYNTDKSSKAFIGWNGFSIFDKDIDIVKLGLEYAKQYQLYSEACGRCAPGRWGGRILYDVFDKIARGEGEFSDLEHLKEIASTMQTTSKCEIGKTVPTPLLQMIEHYASEFEDLIKNKKKSKYYDDDNVTYISKVTAPCMDACPAHVDIPAYIEGVRDLQFEDSLKATRQTMPLAHTCGRVCPHPCENECRRANLDSPISIMELKRVGANYETDHKLEWFHPQAPKPRIGKKVAIIGAGPAGLTVAYYLGLDGIDCDIFEELPVLGGEVAVGVPEYRMPWVAYSKDIELVTSMETTKVFVNTRVNAEKLKELYETYDAVLLSFGARLSKKIRCDNERTDMKGYWGAIDFLDNINLYEKWGIGNKVDLTGKTVVCVGGGFTSMDVVRCAVRAGASRVIMLYRRDEKTIINNTSYEEYHEAVEEGVEFMFQAAVERLNDEENQLKSILINTFELQAPVNGGRAELVKIEGGDITIDADYIIPAVSQSSDMQLLPEEWGIELTTWGSIKTNGKDFMTNKKGLFAAGDCEYGPMTIVNAVGQAKRASSVISRYVQTGEITLLDEEIMEDHLRALRVYDKKEKVKGWLAGLPRQTSEKLHVNDRINNNKEVNFGFTQDEAIAEAERCMRCYYIATVAV